MSSGKYKRSDKFNPIQIKDGNIVRLRKDGTVKAVLGKYGEYSKKNKSNQINTFSLVPSFQQYTYHNLFL